MRDTRPDVCIRNASKCIVCGVSFDGAYAWVPSIDEPALGMQAPAMRVRIEPILCGCDKKGRGK